MDQVTLKIDGMHCSMCESHVNEAIDKAMPGKAKKIRSSHRKGTTTFLVEAGEDISPALEALAREGYRVESVDRREEQKRPLFSFLQRR